MDCECNRLPHIFNVERQANDLRDRLEIIDEKDCWLKLGKCLVCGQHWQLDEWDKYKTICAIKNDAPNKWQNFDDEADRLQFLIESRGCLSEENCLKANCRNRALKSLAFCPLHAFEIGLRE